MKLSRPEDVVEYDLLVARAERAEAQLDELRKALKTSAETLRTIAENSRDTRAVTAAAKACATAERALAEMEGQP